jgi:hypothetical protein
MKLINQIFFGAIMCISGTLTNAATYNLSLGTVITGSFEAVDYNNDGMIKLNDGELLDFFAFFSGNSAVPASTYTYSDSARTQRFNWIIGTNYLGDEEGESFFVNAVDYDAALYTYPGVDATMISYYEAGNPSGVHPHWDEYIAVTAVPIPASLWLFSFTLASLGIGRALKSFW